MTKRRSAPYAIAIPSNVAVPLPSSSRITSERGVALLRMSDVSSSSTRKVDRPAMIASFAPTRVKIRSTGESEQHSAATQQPNCAISTVRQACLKTVDLPPMFGPVTRRKRGVPGAKASPMMMSLGMQCASVSDACTQILTPPLMFRNGSASTNEGRHMPFAAETCASEIRQSISAAHATARRQSTYCREKALKWRRAAAASAISSDTFAAMWSSTSERISSVQNRR
mmetsp:Transcript_3027/g.10132  ORF Transcript_3027/g.10132 Transcript_3027/m.10132 type:complete len:227 (+) Transcript_3027:1054-1734(+)